MPLVTPTSKFGIKITTVDPLTGSIQGVLKTGGKANILVYTATPAFRWPQVGESWMVRQENGWWYLDSAWTDPNAKANLTQANPGDVVLTAPTGVVHVMGSTDGSTDFSIVGPAQHQPGDLISSAALVRAGSLLCDGSAYSRTTYATLYAAIGTAYGVGDGVTTFNVPDLRGRVPIGAGTGTAAGATAHALGQQPTSGNGGEETHTLTTPEIPSHTHPPGSGTFFVESANTLGTAAGGAAFTLSSVHAATGSTGGGGAHNNMQPVSVVNWFVYHG